MYPTLNLIRLNRTDYDFYSEPVANIHHNNLASLRYQVVKFYRKSYMECI